MKKTITTLALGLLMTSTLMADFMRLEMGAGAWLNTGSGIKNYTLDGSTGDDISQEQENTNPYLWVLIKHPVPILPNLRLEYVSVSTNGIANGNFEDFTASNAPTQFDMTQYDVIPYYNILDNTAWTTLDIGLDIKIVEVEYRADDVDLVGNSQSGTYRDSATVPLPLLYARLRIEIPGTVIGLEADAKFVEYDGDRVYDLRAKIDYTLDFLAIEPALEFGYRAQKYDIADEDEGGKIYLEFSGFYAGAMLRF